MIDLDFEGQITPSMTRRLKNLPAWFEKYATDGLRGEELEPGPLYLRQSTQPSICLLEEIHSISVLEVADLGDGDLEARCSVRLDLELDLNNEDWDSSTVSATMEITLRIQTRERRITGHHVHEAYDCEY